MNVLLINQYYPPDRAPTGQYLQDLAQALDAHGHAVTVLCSRRGYEVAWSQAAVDRGSGRIRVLHLPVWSFVRARMLGRIAGDVSFLLLVLRRGLMIRPRPDLVLCLTTPPYLGLLGRFLAHVHGAVHAHWVMDVYPDALEAHGLLKRTAWAYRALEWLARHQWSDSRLLIALGPRMEDRLRHLCGRARVATQALWARAAVCRPVDARVVNRMRSERGWDRKWVLAYSGHLGRGHDLDGLVAALALGHPPGMRMAVPDTPAGRLLALQLQTRAPSVPIDLLPHAKESELAEHLATADVHLVSVRHGWDGIVVPSKLQGVMAIGRPVLILAPARAEVARWIRESGAGWVEEPDDTTGISLALRSMADHAERERRGAAASALAGRSFDRSAALARMLVLVERAGEGSSRRPTGLALAGCAERPMLPPGAYPSLQRKAGHAR